ncbi:methyltransferase family protein [Sneathiella litorea]|uniref:Isoprenylcysteine carboxylmethyltransferase family protein n=1 Tax=Sneathiella litorea TaxID=2606216 RepID=A0A6L8W9I7_9PROT|nr:isoprenylcysteine carboxylmethyltransferase family protein [Sneathiella litorea]MZR31399.1 isoprenylcysteine carboxylmethyltransferase family protein [Sneathiella litorea]
MTKHDNPGVKIPPPLFYMAFLVAGILLDSAWMNGHLASVYLTIIGGVIAIISLIYLIGTARKHKNVESNVEPWKPTTKIISDGVYKYSRNPIYVAMGLFYAGIAIAAGSWPALILLPVCLVIIRYYVIGREEAYLEDKFGKEYLDYKAKVRRWL